MKITLTYQGMTGEFDLPNDATPEVVAGAYKALENTVIKLHRLSTATDLLHEVATYLKNPNPTKYDYGQMTARVFGFVRQNND